MKDAMLWKRVLNEGLNRQSISRVFNLESIERSIIRGPLIVSRISGDIDRRMPKWAEFRGIAPPFPSFWIEGICTADFDDGTAQIPWGVTMLHAAGDGTIIAHPVIGRPDVPPTLLGTCVVSLTESGDVVADENGASQFKVVPTDYLVQMCRRSNVEPLSTVTWGVAAAFECLMLMGCKNVSLAPRDNDPKQVRRAIKRHGGTPDSYRYHVLVVRPPGAKSDAPAQEIGIMPRHVCRGHFAEYGPEFNKGLLFGKYAGRFYVPPHLKGDKKNGEVAKDYALPAA